MTAGLGHNQGPSLEAGQAWRTHCWRKARADLLPNLPIEILRRRVARAKELGLDYKSYASVRASTGRDVIGFLFSSNALRVFSHATSLPKDRGDKLDALKDCSRIALVSQPLNPDHLATAIAKGQLDHAAVAPNFTTSWPGCRSAVQEAIAGRKLPADGVLLIGDTSLEREWSEAGKLAGYLPADRYFVGTQGVTL